MTIGHHPQAGVANAHAAAVIVRGLYEAGSRHAVVSPGSRNTPLVLALHAARSAFDDFHVTVMVDERSAGFLALGIARATGRPVILSCSSGSAGAHYHPAFVEADRSGIPLIAITADRPAELHERGAPQTVNQQRMFEPHVRTSVNLPVPNVENAAGAARSAVSAVTSALVGPNHGPAHLNMQCHEPLWPHDWTSEAFVELLEHARIPRPSATQHEPADDRGEIKASLAPLLEELAGVKRGLILAGPVELARFRNRDALTAYREAVYDAANTLGWPILADPASQLRVRNSHDCLIVENYDLVLRSPAFRAAMAPAAVLTFGEWPTSKVLGQYLASHKPALRNVANGLGLKDPWDLSGYALSTDSASPHDHAWSPIWAEAQAVAHAKTAARTDGLWEGRIAQTIGELLSENLDIHVGSSMPIRDLDGFMRAYDRDGLVFASRGANGIDGTIATAAGEAIGTGRPLIAWMGDLTFLHDAGSLAWVPAEVPLTIVVSDNRGGGIFRHLPIAANDDVFESYFLTPPSVDVAAVAQGFGWEVEVVSDAEALHTALAGSMSGGRRVIIATIDGEENLRIHREIWQSVAEAVEEIDSLHIFQAGASA